MTGFNLPIFMQLNRRHYLSLAQAVLYVHVHMHVHGNPVFIPSVKAGQWACTDTTTVLSYHAAVDICGSYSHMPGHGVVQSVQRLS